ncbi:hypothetical protein GCM10011607_11750 [Shewanella inventionis]|uniref:ParB/RepB/Spo0J family partition protein n=1 Tax=Shewanella inventionis TaxID=1738770 RepID=A0ABQ1IYK2_9GAMM|nr:hypothetical protein [Shewanella inventionis]GGB52905.1 hypothetical protein GCM10011607_11750 [Shewanella inventionis]
MSYDFLVPGVNKAVLEKAKAAEDARKSTADTQKGSRNRRPNPKDVHNNALNSAKLIAEKTDDELIVISEESTNLTDVDSEMLPEQKIKHKEIELASGRVVDFYEIFIPHSQLADSIVVLKDNPRWQEALSEFNTKDLIDSLKTTGQLYNCYGEVLEDGRISNWDGSRRLFAAEKAGIGLNFTVTKARDISASDIQALIEQLALFEEQSIYDKGMQFAYLQNNFKYSHSEIAKIKSVSKSTVTRYINSATSIPPALIRLFPVTNELSARDLDLLANMCKKIYSITDDIDTFISNLKIDIGTSKSTIFKLLKDSLPVERVKAETSNDTPLYKALDKQKLKYKVSVTVENFTDEKRERFEKFLKELQQS